MLWILKPVDAKSGPWEPWYDKCFGMVVRAPDEAAARQLAAKEANDEAGRDWIDGEFKERPNPWLDPALSSCVRLTDEGEQGVVLKDVWWA